MNPHLPNLYTPTDFAKKIHTSVQWVYFKLRKAKIRNKKKIVFGYGTKTITVKLVQIGTKDFIKTDYWKEEKK